MTTDQSSQWLLQKDSETGLYYLTGGGTKAITSHFFDNRFDLEPFSGRNDQLFELKCNRNGSYSLLFTIDQNAEYPYMLAVDSTGSCVKYSDDETASCFVLAPAEKPIPEPEETTTVTTQTTERVSGLLRGDVDCDGSVRIADAVLLARYLAEDDVTVTAEGRINAELNGEEGLTSDDLSCLLQYLAGSLTL